MKCHKCGEEIPDDSLFCIICGEPVKSPNLGSSKTSGSVVVTENNGVARVKSTESVQMPSSPQPSAAKTSKGAVTAIVLLSLLAVVLAIFAGVNSNNYHSSEANVELLRSKIEDLELKNKALESSRDKALSNLNEAKSEAWANSVNSKKYEEIETWFNKHGSEYNASKDYYSNKNLVAVKVGKSVNLSITYKGKRYAWLGTTNGNCSADWASDFSNNKATVKITGKEEGLSEVVFSLGNKNNSDDKESFRVLVIVFD